MSLECSVNTQSDHYLVTVSGEMTASCCGQVLDTVHEQIESVDRAVIIDLGKVDYVDSRGLGILVSIFTHMKKFEYPFYIVAIQVDVMKIIKMTALHTILPIQSSVESALEEINGT